MSCLALRLTAMHGLGPGHGIGGGGIQYQTRLVQLDTRLRTSQPPFSSPSSQEALWDLFGHSGAAGLLRKALTVRLCLACCCAWLANLDTNPRFASLWTRHLCSATVSLEQKDKDEVGALLDPQKSDWFRCVCTP